MHLSKLAVMIYIILAIIVRSSSVIDNGDQDGCRWSPFCMMYQYLTKYPENDVNVLDVGESLDDCTDFELYPDAECSLNDKHIVIINVIGTGGSATIYSVKYAGTVYALKLFKNERTINREREYQKELKVLLLLENVNSIPNVYDYQNGNYPCILMQYFIYGDLTKYMSYNYNTHAPSLMIDVVVKFLKDIGSALYNLHKIGINHMDVKPDNILYDLNPLRFYLTDYAFSVPFNDGKVTDCMGCRPYLTPEHLKIHKNKSAIISHVSCIDRYNMVCIYNYIF